MNKVARKILHNFHLLHIVQQMPKLTMPTTERKSKNLGVALRGILRDLEMSQYQFSRLTGFDPSKTSRVIRGDISCDAETVDAMVKILPDQETKFALVEAYLRDMTCPESRAAISVVPRGGRGPRTLDATMLSADGRSALEYILARVDEGHHVESIFVDFARAIGWSNGKKG